MRYNPNWEIQLFKFFGKELEPCGCYLPDEQCCNDFTEYKDENGETFVYCLDRCSAGSGGNKLLPISQFLFKITRVVSRLTSCTNKKEFTTVFGVVTCILEVILLAGIILLPTCFMLPCIVTCLTLATICWFLLR